MEDVVLELIADGVLAILLLFTIIYSVKLNKRIRVLQDSKSELAQLIKRFDESTAQATAGINEIHKASKIINEHIQTHIEKANYVADDLAFMIEKGGSIIKKLSSSDTAGGGHGIAGEMGASSAGAGAGVGGSDPIPSSGSGRVAGSGRRGRRGRAGSKAIADEGGGDGFTPVALDTVGDGRVSAQSPTSAGYNREAERSAMIKKAEEKMRKSSKAGDIIGKISGKKGRKTSSAANKPNIISPNEGGKRLAPSKSEQELIDSLRGEY